MDAGAGCAGEKSSDVHKPDMTASNKDEHGSTMPETRSDTAMLEDPQKDPQPPTTSSISTTFDYFTTDPTQVKNSSVQSSPQQPPTTSRPTTSVAGSDALAPGTILPPDSTSLTRPVPQRDHSSATVLSMQSNDSNTTVTQGDTDDEHVTSALSACDILPVRPAYPNQAYAALQSQVYPTRNPPPVLRQRSSHPSHILNFPPSIHTSGVRTVGNSPAATPSAGLYSPKVASAREEWNSPETPGTYASPYLHPMHRQAPKETHVADVDVDPISGRKLINHYEIVDELGRGTHGKVKLGRDLHTEGRFVAIKIVARYSQKRRLGRLGNPEDKVKKEVAILKKARHPNIVALLEVIDDPSLKKVYIILEHVERGTIHWRAKAPREIALLEAHRYERERSGIQTGASQAEDNAIAREVAKRLHRRKQEINRLYRRARRERDGRIDHYGGNEESDDDTLSRISTTTNESSLRSSKQRAEDEAPATTPQGAVTPTIGQPDLLDPLDQAGRETITEDLRQWAIHVVDDDLNPELQYVPCMSLQSIRVAFRDTLLGLQYLHFQGIIHRDIKPPNLLQTKNDRVKISDFGVSYLGKPVTGGETGEDVSESEAKDLDTEAKELAKTVGTPAFYAPELCITDHAEDPPPVTKAIDVWALGVTLFCMLFGRTPYVDNEFVVMRQIADEEIYLPRRRLRPVDEQPKSRPNSRTRAYSPLTADRRSEFDIAYEEIDEDLHDLMARMLVKDPRKRITVEEIRHHAWTTADLPNKMKWLEETDESRQNQGKKIEVSKEDVNTAVVPLQFLERMRSGIKKIGDRLLGSASRGRSVSSANSASAPNSQPPSAHSSSSTISQDARRHSLRTEEIAFALKAHRESDHPLSKSLAASPEYEKSNRDFFDDMPPHLGPFNDFGASLAQTMSHDSAARPALGVRSKTGFSTTGSIRTIKQSDFADPARPESPPSPGLPGTPRALETAAHNNFSGLLGGSHRNVFKTIRERSSTRSFGDKSRQSSQDRASVSSKDAHAEPSLAVSETLVPGRLQAPDILSPGFDSEPPPSTGFRSAIGSLSRHSSSGSVKSSARFRSHDLTPIHHPQAIGSTEEEWNRGQQEHMRRLLQETTQPPRPASAFDDRICPPSPDDDRSRKSSDARRISDFDISHPSSSYETSPVTHGVQKIASHVSSSSDFGSAVSMSISNPSIPSVISEASSVDRTDGVSREESESKHNVSSYDTITGNPEIREDPIDEGYNPDEDTALDSDNDEYDSDTDSDGGLVMSRRKSVTKMALSSSPRNTSLSAALEAHHKQRRGTNFSRSSKKSSRSGSNNTMKKVRTRDSIDERRRPSSETYEGRS